MEIHPLGTRDKWWQMWWKHGIMEWNWRHSFTSRKTRSFLFGVSQAGVSLHMLYLFVVYTSINLYIYICFVGKDKKGPSTFVSLSRYCVVSPCTTKVSTALIDPATAPHGPVCPCMQRRVDNCLIWPPYRTLPAPCPPDHGSWWCFGEALETPCLIWMLYHIYIYHRIPCMVQILPPPPRKLTWQWKIHHLKMDCIENVDFTMCVPWWKFAWCVSITFKPSSWFMKWCHYYYFKLSL